jgi:hypothetical protein
MISLQLSARSFKLPASGFTFRDSEARSSELEARQLDTLKADS